jgi:MinD-like ATPase involved in chromosome partitioning or flagellar assembly
MSMLSFLKHFLLRVLERYFIRDNEIVELLRSSYKMSMEEEQTVMEVLIKKMTAIDRGAGEKVSNLLNTYRPRIVFNMGEHPDEIGLADQINKSLWKVLSLRADYFGFIFKDQAVPESVKERTTLLHSDRESFAAEDLKRLAKRIVKYWDTPVENSAQLLYKTTQEIYRER